MTKIFYLYDKFFELNQNFTTENVKIVKSPGFLVILFKFQVFPGFFLPKFSNSRFLQVSR